MPTQAGLAFSLYEKNPKISHQEFVAKFLEQFPSCSPKNAALYWQNKARRAKFGLAPVALPAEYKGIVEQKVRKTKEIPAKQMIADVLPPALRKAKLKKQLVTAKSDEEMEAIRASNLARMKEVSAKQKKYSQVARPDGPGVKNFDPKVARAEVDSILADESLSAPKFLTKDQVKALV